MKLLLSATLLASILLPAMPASAQMREPTMKQCRMGYKTSYMRSMDWSRRAFMRACEHKMMMMKKRM